MSWNYRIIKYKDGSGFGLHEVYYDKSGHPYAMTNSPTSFVQGTEEDAPVLIKSLCMALTDALERPVFDEPEEWPGETI